MTSAAELGQRAVALLDSQVDDALPRLALAGDDDDPGAAATAPVAAVGLGCVERGHQPLGERAGRRLEASPIASQTRGDSTMFACAIQSSPRA